MSVEVRHGDAAVAVGGDDRPPVPVPDGFSAVGEGGAIDAPGDDDVADRRRLTAYDTDGALPEVTALVALLLHGEVECVDVVVRLGDEGDRASLIVWSTHWRAASATRSSKTPALTRWWAK